MTEETKENVKEKLDELFDEFNAILVDKALGNLTIQYFKLRDITLGCRRPKRVCRNGTCYIICLD